MKNKPVTTRTPINTGGYKSYTSYTLKTYVDKVMTIATTKKIKPKRKLSSFFDNFIEKSKVPTSKTKDESLTETLNRMIAAGASFDVAADDFQVCGADRLTESDKSFLRQNKSDVLCTLQQSLLTKHLFSVSPDALEDFTFDVTERETIMTNGADIPFAVHCEAVKDVSSNWFDRTA